MRQFVTGRVATLRRWRLLVTLWEDDVEVADLREVARLFQFRPIEPLLRRLDGPG
jgi:hypothetical protein